MNEVRISDVTMKQAGTPAGFSLTFKETLEIAKLLDRLFVSVIEIDGVSDAHLDALRIKSIAAAVKNSILAVPVGLGEERVAAAWGALKESPRPRLQVEAPVSPVQMEYLLHKKPDAVLSSIKSTVAACKACTQDVEFLADDATRSDEAFLYEAVRAAISAGASTVTVCDTAGAMLPDEFEAFLSRLYEHVPELSTVCLGVSCANELAMADACAIAAVRMGARELKAAAYGTNSISLQNTARVLASKGEMFGVHCPVRTTELKRLLSQIAWMCETGCSKKSPFDNRLQSGEAVMLSRHDDIQAVLKTTQRLGYDLSDEDGQKVWEAFSRIAAKKKQVSSRELDAIIAAAAMQVPATYKVESYVINTGNIISAMAHMKLRRQETLLEGISVGDGPIDAAFLAIEQITGRHYELDDFQIQAVTEGREAMGETVVKLRSNGKLYSGRGISTDIVESGIRAYLNALNKIAYEEAAT